MDNLISVVLPVYNGREYLREAIQSILEQTYTNFELIIINDGSKDDSEAIIKSFNDSRIHYYYQNNQGLAATLNRGISSAKGEFIARMDQDDVSLPRRFELQLNFLITHPNYGMVGTWAEIWARNKKTKRRHFHPTKNYLLQYGLLFYNPFVHSSMMIRKQVFNTVGYYSTDPSRQPPEDYELWSRVCRNYKVANLPQILFVYRELRSGMTRTGTGKDPFLQKVIKISVENLLWYLKQANNCVRIPPDIELLNISHFLHCDFKPLTPSFNIKTALSIPRICIDRIAAKKAKWKKDLNKEYNKKIRYVLANYVIFRLGKVFGGFLRYSLIILRLTLPSFYKMIMED